MMRGRAEFPDGFGVDPTFSRCGDRRGHPASASDAPIASPTQADPGLTPPPRALPPEGALWAIVRSVPPAAQPSITVPRRWRARGAADSMKQASGLTVFWVSTVVGLLLAASAYVLNYP